MQCDHTSATRHAVAPTSWMTIFVTFASVYGPSEPAESALVVLLVDRLPWPTRSSLPIYRGLLHRPQQLQSRGRFKGRGRQVTFHFQSCSLTVEFESQMQASHGVGTTGKEAGYLKAGIKTASPPSIWLAFPMTFLLLASRCKPDQINIQVPTRGTAQVGARPVWSGGDSAKTQQGLAGGGRGRLDVRRHVRRHPSVQFRDKASPVLRQDGCAIQGRMTSIYLLPTLGERKAPAGSEQAVQDGCLATLPILCLNTGRLDRVCVDVSYVYRTIATLEPT